MIRAFAYIDATTGELLNLQFPQGDPPAEGINDAGLRVGIITDENLPEESCLDYHYFIQNYVYDSSSSSFLKVGHKPNSYATWDLSSSSWSWDPLLVLRDIRQVRNTKLFYCDWTVGADSPLTDSQKSDALAYRRALRDITSTLDNPSNTEDVSWPTPPSFLA